MVKGLFKLYKRSFTEAYFFGYVSCLKENVSVTTEKAVLNFMNHHKLTDADVNVKSLISTYNRMKTEYFDTQKTTTNG